MPRSARAPGRPENHCGHLPPQTGGVSVRNKLEHPESRLKYDHMSGLEAWAGIGMSVRGDPEHSPLCPGRPDAVLGEHAAEPVRLDVAERQGAPAAGVVEFGHADRDVRAVDDQPYLADAARREDPVAAVLVGDDHADRGDDRLVALERLADRPGLVAEGYRDVQR